MTYIGKATRLIVIALLLITFVVGSLIFSSYFELRRNSPILSDTGIADDLIYLPSEQVRMATMLNFIGWIEGKVRKRKIRFQGNVLEMMEIRDEINILERKKEQIERTIRDLDKQTKPFDFIPLQPLESDLALPSINA